MTWTRLADAGRRTRRPTATTSRSAPGCRGGSASMCERAPARRSVETLRGAHRRVRQASSCASTSSTMDPPRPTSVKAEATVTDVNRQAWTAARQPARAPGDALRRAARASGSSCSAASRCGRRDRDRHRRQGRRPGRAFTVQGRAAGLGAGRGRVEGGAGRRAGLRRSTSGAEAPCAARSRRARAAPSASRAVVADDRERREPEPDPPVGRGRQGAARAAASSRRRSRWCPDKQEYRAGDTAEVLVLAPFSPAEGLLTLRRSGLVRTSASR